MALRAGGRMAAAAHFLGIGAGISTPTAGKSPEGEETDAERKAREKREKEAKDKEPEPKEPDAEDETDAERKAREKREKKAKKAKRRGDAEDGDPDASSERDPDEDGDDDEDEEDDDDNDREDMKKAALLADPAHRQQAVVAVLERGMDRKRGIGRRAERSRCAAIFAHPHAAKNPNFAANVAFNTRLTGREAAAMMSAAPATGGGLGQRMSGVTQPALGPGGERSSSGPQQTAAAWDTAIKSARGA